MYQRHDPPYSCFAKIGVPNLPTYFVCGLQVYVYHESTPITSCSTSSTSVWALQPQHPEKPLQPQHRKKQKGTPPRTNPLTSRLADSASLSKDIISSSWSFVPSWKGRGRVCKRQW